MNNIQINMIKVTNLMTGDWVQNQDGSIKGRVINIDTYQNRVEFGAHTIDADFVYPIPLTEEILEKNGFWVDVYSWLDVGDEKILEYYIFEHRLSLWYEGGKSQELLFKCQCFSVHELQHALKLWGIEKEIVL